MCSVEKRPIVQTVTMQMEREAELEGLATGVSSVHCYIMHRPTSRESISKQ